MFLLDSSLLKKKGFHVLNIFFTLLFTLGVQPKEKAKVTPNSQPTFTGMYSYIYLSQQKAKTP